MTCTIPNMAVQKVTLTYKRNTILILLYFRTVKETDKIRIRGMICLKNPSTGRFNRMIEMMEDMIR
jgi:hypothetical protein